MKKEGEILMSVEEKNQKNKGGRPKKYDTEYLKELLYKYVSNENPNKVKVADLVKYTDIPIQAWRFNEDIKKEINLVNKKIEDITVIAPIKDVKELWNIPSAEDIVIKNYKNKNKLVEVIDTLLEAYQFSLEKSLHAEELERENLHLKSQIASLKEDIEFYKDEMKKMAVQSTLAIERNENKLKDNIIDIKSYSETKTTFKDLFDD